MVKFQPGSGRRSEIGPGSEGEPYERSTVGFSGEDSEMSPIQTRFAAQRVAEEHFAMLGGWKVGIPHIVHRPGIDGRG